MTLEPLFIVGPTASGKSVLALALAERLGGEIVNADAFQLYAGLDICTAKPSAAELSRVPHHLFSAMSPDEICNAGIYEELARKIIRSIQQRGKLPIVVGGSGLYVKSLTHRLMPLPSSHGLRERLEHLTLAERASWLLHRDPDAASNVNLKNERHVGRALEICLLTGQPQSKLRQSWQNSPPDYRGFKLVWDRDILNARIDRRVLNMVQSGLVAEIAATGHRSSTADKVIGLCEIRSHLAGEISLDEAIASIQLASRRYARRQEKWFKREKRFTALHVSEDDKADDLVAKALAVMPELNPR